MPLAFIIGQTAEVRLWYARAKSFRVENRIHESHQEGGGPWKMLPNSFFVVWEIVVSRCVFFGGMGRECDGNATGRFVQEETHQKKIVDASSVRLNDMKGKVY